MKHQTVAQTQFRIDNGNDILVVRPDGEGILIVAFYSDPEEDYREREVQRLYIQEKEAHDLAHLLHSLLHKTKPKKKAKVKKNAKKN